MRNPSENHARIASNFIGNRSQAQPIAQTYFNSCSISHQKLFPFRRHFFHLTPLIQFYTSKVLLAKLKPALVCFNRAALGLAEVLAGFYGLRRTVSSVLFDLIPLWGFVIALKKWYVASSTPQKNKGRMEIITLTAQDPDLCLRIAYIKVRTIAV